MSETTTQTEVKDAQQKADEGVLAGVLREPATEPPAPVPARRGRRAPAAGKAPAKTTPATRKAPATAKTTPAKTGKAPAKTAKAPATTGKPKAEANGSGTQREGNQKLAVELVELVAGHFGKHSKADQQKVANWLKVLPTGGAGYQRYWPKGLVRPNTADWAKPE